MEQGPEQERQPCGEHRRRPAQGRGRDLYSFLSVEKVECVGLTTGSRYGGGKMR